MKILIIGEYSGFAKNLRIGFESLGHETVIFQEGDTWKKIDVGDNSYSYPFKSNFKIFSFSLKLTWILKGLFYYLRFKKDIRRFHKYFDFVLITNYEFIRFSHEVWLPRFSVENIIFATKDDDAKIYLSACGDDYAYLQYLNKFRYTSPINLNVQKYLSKRYLGLLNQSIRIIEGVIPVMCDYALAYRSVRETLNLNIYKTIPLPISVESITCNNIVNEKVIIFHGLNRECKGTDLIVEALEIIKEKYPLSVEVIIDGKMPLADYLNILNRTNIVIDQCYSYSYGMNALYSMAMGKVVLSGNEPENAYEFNRNDIPVVNILPDVQDIVSKIEYFILNKDDIAKVGLQSRKFVEDFHSPQKIATQYLSIYYDDYNK